MNQLCEEDKCKKIGEYFCTTYPAVLSLAESSKFKNFTLSYVIFHSQSSIEKKCVFDYCPKIEASIEFAIPPHMLGLWLIKKTESFKEDYKKQIKKASFAEGQGESLCDVFQFATADACASSKRPPSVKTATHENHFAIVQYLGKRKNVSQLDFTFCDREDDNDDLPPAYICDALPLLLKRLEKGSASVATGSLVLSFLPLLCLWHF